MDFRNEDAMELDTTQDDMATFSDAPSPAPGPASGKAIDMQAPDSGSEELVGTAAISEKADAALAGAMMEAVKASAEPVDDSKKINDRRFQVVTDSSRDALLTEFGKETLIDRYLLPGEEFQDLFARVADAYAAEAMGGTASMVYALRKLAEQNLSNLVPHPVFSWFYYSHPTLLERERALEIPPA